MEHFSLLLPEIADALNAGFTEHFLVRPDGLLFFPRAGSVHEFYDASFQILSSVPGTLLLITLPCGKKGYDIEYWDHWS